MRRRNSVSSSSSRRRQRIGMLLTWGLALLLAWLLVRIVLALVGDFWVMIIALSQP